MDEQVGKYNRTIREILDQISGELPDHALVSTIHRRFRVALSIDRTYIIEETAPEMLLYRDVIAEGRWDDLIYKDWESEIDNQSDAMMHEVDNNSLRDMVGLLRQLWENHNDEQRDQIKRRMKKMLSYVVKYYKAKAEGRP